MNILDANNSRGSISVNDRNETSIPSHISIRHAVNTLGLGNRCGDRDETFRRTKYLAYERGYVLVPFNRPNEVSGAFFRGPARSETFVPREVIAVASAFKASHLSSISKLRPSDISGKVQRSYRFSMVAGKNERSVIVTTQGENLKGEETVRYIKFPNRSASHTISSNETESAAKKTELHARKPAGIEYGHALFDSRQTLRDYHESVADAFLEANPYGAN